MTTETLIDIENEQPIIDDRHIKLVVKAVKERISGLEGFGRINGRENMNITSNQLREKLNYWLMGVYNVVPSELQKIKNKGY